MEGHESSEWNSYYADTQEVSEQGERPAWGTFPGIRPVCPGKTDPGGAAEERMID